ncbi:hypothetical protein JCM9279_006144 [Rhodotorula babjevae]
MEPRKRRRYIDIEDRVAGKKALKEANEDLGADLFLNLPFDLLFELSRTSRSFRSLFLSKSSRQIWAAVRQRDGYLKPDSMKDAAFAIVLVGDKCQVAGCTSTKKVSTLWALGGRLCKSCIDALLISRAGAKKIDDLHKKTLSCTPFALFADCFVKSSLEKTSAKLFELEADVANSRASSSTKASRNVKGKQGSSTALDDYVKNAQQHVEQVKQDVLTIEQGLKNVEIKLQKRQELAAEQARIDKVAAAESFDDELKRDHGWTDKLLDYLSGGHGGGGWMRSLKAIWLSREAPKVKPSIAPKAWLEYRIKVENHIKEVEYEERVGPDREARLERLRIYYAEIKDGLAVELEGVVPNFDELKELEDVKELYHGEHAQLDDSTWPTQKDIVSDAVREHAEAMRVHAIRTILAAETGSTLKPLSKTPPKNKYSPGKYDAAFFSKLTSLFRCRSKDERKDVVVPWPEVLKHKDERSTIAFFLEYSLTYKSACALRSVLVAADLDDDEKTSPSELDALGEAFSWTERPKTTCSNKSWLEMARPPLSISYLNRHGPSIVDLKAGKTAKVDFAPPADSSTMQVEALDSSGDV